MFQVGDKVLYVPDTCHAFDREPDGTFTYEIGKKDRVGAAHRLQRKAGDGEGNVQTVEGRDLDILLRAIRREGPNSPNRERLVFVRPKRGWEATVTAVNEDGTVNLDIKPANSAFTLHYDNVPVQGMRGPSDNPACPVPHSVVPYCPTRKLS